MPIQKGPLGNDISSTEIAAGAVTYAKLASDIQRSGMKNRIINGAMVIDQRNAGASVATSSGTQVYSVDRWQGFYSATNKYTMQQNVSSITPPVGFKNYLGATSSAATSLSASDYYLLNQRIEGYNVADLGFGTADAKTVTLSFWVRSSLTGTFGGSICPTGDARSYVFSYSIPAANTWTQISITVAGDTTGTWNTTNGVGMSIYFGLGVGSTLSTTAGSWVSGSYYNVTGATSVVGTNGATFYITGVQLEVGASATGFEYRQYQQELALCERYYEASTADLSSINSCTMFNGRVATGNTYWAISLFKVDKRAAPTMVLTNQANAAFSTTTGVEGSTTKGYREARVASGVADAGYYFTSWTASAEL